MSLAPRTFTPILLCIALVAMVWLPVFAYWHMTASTPDGGEIVRWLVALPVALLSGFGLAYKSLQGSANSAKAHRPAAATGASATDPKAKRKDAGGSLPMCVLGARLRTAHAATAAELLDAIAEGKRAELDSQLRNSSNLPIFAARIQDLDVSRLRERIAEANLPATGDAPVDGLADDRLRSIALLFEVLQELLVDAQDHVRARIAPEQGSASPARSGSVSMNISVAVPAWWSEPEQLLAVQWLQHAVTLKGLDFECRFNGFAASPGSGALALLERTGTSHEADASPWIVLAAESSISDSRVARWETSGLLHVNERQPGCIPGEAAAGVLLAYSASVEGGGSESQGSWLSQSMHARRTESADTSGTSDAIVLAGLTEKLLAASGKEAAAVQWLVSDSDHRIGRLKEFLQLRQDKLPHLGFESQCVAFGQTCAYTGVAGELIGMVLGSHLAQEHGQFVLVASLQDAHVRSVTLLGPAKSGASASAA